MMPTDQSVVLDYVELAPLLLDLWRKNGVVDEGGYLGLALRATGEDVGFCD